MKIETSNIYCVLKTLLINDHHFYTEDDGITYHSCKLNHYIANCEE